MEFARAVDASATRANRISEDREKKWNSRPDDSRHLEHCKRGLEFSSVMVFMITFPFCLWSYLNSDYTLVGGLRFRYVRGVFS
jgi:hypothetical protein